MPTPAGLPRAASSLAVLRRWANLCPRRHSPLRPLCITRVIANLERGGAQLGVLRLTEALRRVGIVTRIFAGEASPPAVALFRGAGIEVEVWGGEHGLQYALSSAFADWLRPRLSGADVVHAHMVGGWWAAANALGGRVPLAASEHNALQWPSTPATERLRAALARVDVFYAHGPDARASILELGCPRDRLRAGVSAIPIPDRSSDPSLPSPRIVYAGRLHREKGPDLLLEALARMRRPPPTFLLGEGPEERSLRDRSQKLGLDGVVRFEGWQDDPQRWLAGADVCAVPSRYDAWCQTALIAMSLGVPVVAAAVEGMPATLAHGRGVLVRPDDPQALAEALDDVLRGRRAVNLSAARSYAGRFAPALVGEAYASDYRALHGR